MPSEFWELSLAELEDIILARAREKENELKIASALCYQTANLVYAGIVAIIDGKKFPSRAEAFPLLFPQEEENSEKKEEEAEVRQEPGMMERFRAYVEAREKEG